MPGATSSFFVTTSKALVTSSDALVPSSFLLLISFDLVRQMKMPRPLRVAPRQESTKQCAVSINLGPALYEDFYKDSPPVDRKIGSYPEAL